MNTSSSFSSSVARAHEIQASTAKAIDAKWSYYENSVRSLAERAFETVVKPYLEKHHYYLISGNGIYNVFRVDRKGKDISIDIDSELPQYIIDLMEMEVPGMPWASLAMLMPDHLPPKK
jgi:hypothetical protein